MALSPFTWGSAGQKLTPAQAKARRDVANALLANNQAANTFGGGLAKIGDALKGIHYERQADEAEQAGAESRKAIMDALMGNADPTMNDIYGAIGDPWVASDPASSAILQAMMAQEIQQNDPLRQLQIEKGQFELDALRNPPPPAPDYGFTFAPDGTLIRTDTTSGTFDPMGRFAQGEDPTSAIQNYEYLIESGVEPAQAQEMAFGGAGTTINNMGNIPAGYSVEYDEQGRPVTMAPVPGSPAALEAEAAAAKTDMREDQATITSDTVLNEAGKARGLISGWSTGPGQWVFGNLPFTQAAELNRHVSSLKAIASSENINMMRQSSPTGAAMGNTSDADLKLLQDKAGALDPQSSNFPEMLDDYERTLLRIVHGPEVGDAIFAQTRGAAPGASAPIGEPPEGLSPEEWQFLTPEERALWQN